MTITRRGCLVEQTEREFVNREKCIELFENAIKNTRQTKYRVQVYYGVSGIGKSRLIGELQKVIEEYNLADQHQPVDWASINLNTETLREKGTFLVTLKKEFQKKYRVKFHFFEVVHAIYWQKVHPEIPLQKDNYSLFKELGISMLDISDPASSSIIPLILKNVYKASKEFNNFWISQKEEIRKLAEKDPADIEENLHLYWAKDFWSHLQYTSKPAVIFVDTYEALWRENKYKSNHNSRDRWIRELVAELPGVIWVFSGKEELRWVETDENWKSYIHQYWLKELKDKYSLKFLDNCDIEDPKIREVIVESSKGLPLFLNIVADTYDEISKQGKPSPEEFAKTPEQVINRFIDYLDPQEEPMLEALSLARFWDFDLFEALAGKLNYPVTNFSKLCRFSFIQKETGERWSMHDIMREGLQKHQGTQEKKSVHKIIFDFYKGKLENLDIKSITSEHETALTEAFYHAKEALEAEALFKWFISVSDPFYRAAFWQFISPMYEEMQQILEVNLGPGHPSVATTLNNLALLYHQMGDYEKALPLYQRALEISEKVLGPQHPSVAQTLNNIAELYRQMGDYEKALPLYQRALEIREKVLGPQHPSVATTLNNLAALYESMGDYEKALPLYQRALEISEKVLGPQHPSVATTLNNIAELYRQMGDYEKALPLYQRALEIIEKVLGPQHPDVATTLNNLAAFYYQMGDYEKALPLYQRALEIIEKVLGPQHPDVAATLNNLAALYENMGDYEKALPLYKRDLEISEKVLGPEHPSVATTLNNLAGLYKSMGEYEKALPLYKRDLEISEKMLGPEHPSVATTLNNLAGLYKSMGEYEKALPLYKRALEIYEKVLGPEHPSVATTLNNLAGLYKSMGEYEKALPLYKRALETREKVLGPEHPNVGINYGTTAQLYISIGKYSEALPLLEKALDIFQKSFGPEHVYVAIALTDLATLYIQTGKYDEALPLFKQALDIIEKKLGTAHPSYGEIKRRINSLYEKMAK